MTDLTDFERAVINKLLDGNHQVLESLHQQLAVCRIVKRDATGVGFYTYLDVSSYEGPRPTLNLKFGDVVAQIPGLEHGAGFLLYVEAGLLAMLEAYTFGEPWPDRIEDFKLHYVTGEERDWPSLAKLLGKSG